MGKKFDLVLFHFAILFLLGSMLKYHMDDSVKNLMLSVS